MLDLSDNYRAYDAGASRSQDIVKEMESLYNGITEAADLYMNGWWVGYKTLEEAINLAVAEDDDDIIWTINEEEE